MPRILSLILLNFTQDHFDEDKEVDKIESTNSADLYKPYDFRSIPRFRQEQVCLLARPTEVVKSPFPSEERQFC